MIQGLGPLKGVVSAQKALHGSRTETAETRELLGGNEEKSTQRVIDLLSRQINIFYLSGPANICLLAPSLHARQQQDDSIAFSSLTSTIFPRKKFQKSLAPIPSNFLACLMANLEL